MRGHNGSVSEFLVRIRQLPSAGLRLFFLKAVVFVLCGLPAVLSVWDAVAHQSSINPYNAIIRDTGYWSLRFLCVTIAITPVRWLTHWHILIKFRRMMRLF